MNIPTEIRRLPWFTALVLSVVIVIQYLERPAGYFSSSLLSFGKSQPRSHGNDLKSETPMPFNSSSGVSNHLKDNMVIDHNSTHERVVSNKSLEQVSGKNYSSLDNLHNATNGSVSIQSPRPSTDSTGKDQANISDFSDFFNNSSLRRYKGQPAVVVPISAMNDMLHESRLSYESVKPKWHSQVDKELLNARKYIEGGQITDENRHLDVNVYRNYSEFIRSYELMEKSLKIYVYTEGERPIFHQPELVGIYASEGWFMKQLEENKHFVTTDPTKAHLFYLPFSLRLLETTLYVRNSHSRKNLVEHLSLYLHNITTKYQFWNRTDGADHFLVACHDWAPFETNQIMKNCIRALCNANAIKGGFRFGKDVSLPEINVHNATNPLKGIGGKSPSQRSILAFFAGGMHGYLRPIFLNYWEDKDPDMKIFGKLHEVKGHKAYVQYMKSSKYCISAKGYEPYTPRVVEAIFYECVPVILSDNYVPPFFETLNWESFAVFVLEKDIPNLKNILLSISEEKYIEMQERVMQMRLK
ncbi:hypothetical protein OROMI_031173 [Orobanche minor]